MGNSSTKRHAVRGGLGRIALGLLASGACIVALPSALAAVTGAVSPAAELSVSGNGGLGAFTPASVDPKLMDSLRRAVVARTEDAANLFRFTPAGAGKAGTRSVTVAVRVDPETARAVSVRKAGEQAGRNLGTLDAAGFNLGVARGYQSFAQSNSTLPQAGTRSLTQADEIGDIRAPDLRSFTPAKSASGKSRFSAVTNLDAEALPGSTPRTLSGAGEMSVDVGGAYRVADNLKVTAGIRYSSERDRIGALTDEQQDSQSVYVGTRFRF